MIHSRKLCIGLADHSAGDSTGFVDGTATFGKVAFVVPSYRSTIIEEETYFFRCMVYVDLNPVRAGIACSPLEYRWNGHHALRQGDHTGLDFHALYLDGGKDAESRYASYMGILEHEANRPPAPVSLARALFVGSARFVGRMEDRFGLSDSRAQLIRATIVANGGSGKVMTVSPKIGRARCSK
jgi:hypothetical protein